MFSHRKALLFGFFIWLIAFGLAFALFPVRTRARPLFESIMPVVLAAEAVAFGSWYFRGVHTAFVREGILLGSVWMGVNVLMDLPLMLSPSPMQMTLGEYISDIGLTYLLLPLVTTGIGLGRGLGEGRPSPSDAA